MEYKSLVFRNILRSTKVILDAMDLLKLAVEDKSLEEPMYVGYMCVCCFHRSVTYLTRLVHVTILAFRLTSLLAVVSVAGCRFANRWELFEKAEDTYNELTAEDSDLYRKLWVIHTHICACIYVYKHT